MPDDLSPIHFAALTPAQVASACQEAMDRCDAALDALVSIGDGQRSYANTMDALETALDDVSQASGAYAFMAYVSSDDAIRKTAREWDQKLDKYMVDVQFREDLYRAVRAYAETDDAARLDGEERRLLERSLRDYRRNGFDLEPAQRARIRELFDRLIELGNDFRNTIADWEDGIEVGKEQLRGLPEAFVEGLRTIESDGKRLYRVSLDYPEFYPFMGNAEDEDLRRELFLKDQRKGGTENINRLEEAIRVRGEIANILGYESWAAYVVEVRMAKEPGRVEGFLADLREKLEAKAATDMAELAAEKERHTGNGTLNIWDWRFYHNRQMSEHYHVDDFEVAKYFPLDACLDGLFQVTQSLLGIRYEAVPGASTWHPEVRAFDVYEADGAEPFARFYMDLFPRPNTYSHAAAFTIRRGRRLPDRSYQRPISAIVANFTRPNGGRPSLLRHQEVVTLFHEFGHILHQCLTRAICLKFSGTATERDFVEAPSQMLEHWCWDRDVLRRFSRHYESGDPLPPEVIDAMAGAKTLNSGVMTTRQLLFATLDFTYHSPGFDGDTTGTLARLHEITGFPYPEGTHFQSGFGHLFGYDAGYYGYLWSHVFGDDMFTRFEEAGLMNPVVGKEYRQRILEPGGSVDGDDMVRNFLGREPNNAAFLRGLGLEV
jgi:thimet oligopeptidase